MKYRDITLPEELLPDEEFIENAKKIHGNKYNYSKVEYKKAIEKRTSGR